MASPAETIHTKLGKRTRLFTITQSGANNGTVMVEIPEPLSSLSIQVTGTFQQNEAGGQIVDLKATNDSTVANRQALPTAISFSAVGIKSVAQADLGFRHYVVEVTNSGPLASLVITVVAKLV